MLLENFTKWMFETLQPTDRATLAWDDANGPGGWNGNGSASVYIKWKTPALYYQNNEPLTAEQVGVLRRLDAAGIYNSFQVRSPPARTLLLCCRGSCRRD